MVWSGEIRPDGEEEAVRSADELKESVVVVLWFSRRPMVPYECMQRDARAYRSDILESRDPIAAAIAGATFKPYALECTWT